MSKGFITLILIFPFLTYSQNKLEIEGDFKLITHKDSIKIFSQNKLLVYDEKLNLVRDELTTFDKNIKNYEILIKDNKTYFISIRGGEVYKEDVYESLSRIDKSYDHKMQSDSPILIKSDTIFKFGGYGFWSMRNFITYFDLEQFEWFPLDYSNNNLSEGYSNTFFHSIENDFYFFGGNKMNGFFEIKPNFKIYHFSNQKKEWNEIGELDKQFSLDDFHFIHNSSFYIIDESSLIEVDLINKTISSYNKHTSLHSGFDSKNSISTIGNKVFFVTRENDELYLNSIPLEELLSEPITKRSFLVTNYSYLYFLLGFIFFISVILLKRKKTSLLIIVKNQQLLMGRKKLEISKFQYQLINILIDNNRTVNKDFDILNENDYLNKYHFQRTLKNEILQINLVFKTLTSSNDDMIIIKKDEVDKRINIYQLNEHYNFSLK